MSVVVGGEVAGRLTGVPVVPAAGGEGEQPFSDWVISPGIVIERAVGTQEDRAELGIRALRSRTGRRTFAGDCGA